MTGTENRKQKEIFPVETELSEIVRRKTDCAFERIRQEESGLKKMTEKRTGSAGKRKENTIGRRFRMPAAAVAGVCLLAVSSISVAAALHHYWGRGMNEVLQESQKCMKRSRKARCRTTGKRAQKMRLRTRLP